MSTQIVIPTVEEQVYARISCGYYSCITVALAGNDEAYQVGPVQYFAIESPIGVWLWKRGMCVGGTYGSEQRAVQEAKEIATRLGLPYLFHIRSHDRILV